MPVWTLKCRFCLLSAGFGALSAGFAEKKEDEKKEEKIKISRKASPSCALNNTKTWVICFAMPVLVGLRALQASLNTWEGVRARERLLNSMMCLSHTHISMSTEWQWRATQGLPRLDNGQEDKRATTNVQNRFVQFFLLSFLLFCSH